MYQRLQKAAHSEGAYELTVLSDMHCIEVFHIYGICDVFAIEIH
jgi:hypothetical protein